MKIQCPTCKRSDLDTTWRFLVPAHASSVNGKPCVGGDKGSKPNYSPNGKKQLCFRCGQYVRLSAKSCPHCDQDE